MRSTPRSRLHLLSLVAVLALLLGLAACGGSSSDGSSSDKGDASADAGKDGGDGDDPTDTPSNADLPDPCALVSLDQASEILGSQSAEPSPSEPADTSAGCGWVTQESIDSPSVDNAGHVLTLTVFGAPSEGMSVDQLWAASKSAAAQEDFADVENCDEAFWMGGMLSALKGDLYLTGTAGLADDSEDAKAATTALLSAACGSL